MDHFFSFKGTDVNILYACSTTHESVSAEVNNSTNPTRQDSVEDSSGSSETGTASQHILVNTTFSKCSPIDLDVGESLMPLPVSSQKSLHKIKTKSESQKETMRLQLTTEIEASASQLPDSVSQACDSWDELVTKSDTIQSKNPVSDQLVFPSSLEQKNPTVGITDSSKVKRSIKLTLSPNSQSQVSLSVTPDRDLKVETDLELLEKHSCNIRFDNESVRFENRPLSKLCTTSDIKMKKSPSKSFTSGSHSNGHSPERSDDSSSVSKSPVSSFGSTSEDSSKNDSNQCIARNLHLASSLIVPSVDEQDCKESNRNIAHSKKQNSFKKAGGQDDKLDPNLKRISKCTDNASSTSTDKLINNNEDEKVKEKEKVTAFSGEKTVMSDDDSRRPSATHAQGRRSSLPSSPSASLVGNSQDELSVQEKWTCLKCTLKNCTANLVCEACGASRTSTPSASSSDKPIRKKSERPRSVAVTEYWICPLCTLQNHLYSMRCQACRWDKNKDDQVKNGSCGACFFL